MPMDRPDALELIAAVREFLNEKAAPALDGQLHFHARVAANALAIVERELTDGPAMSEAERQRIAALLGEDGDLATLNRELAAAIRRGDLGDERPVLLDHLRRTVADKLAIANPNYLKPR